MTNNEIRALRSAAPHMAIIGAPFAGKTLKRSGETVDERLCEVSYSEALTGRSGRWFAALLPDETMDQFQARMDAAVEAELAAD